MLAIRTGREEKLHFRWGEQVWGEIASLEDTNFSCISRQHPAASGNTEGREQRFIKKFPG
jgi:hypothetical protein